MRYRGGPHQRRAGMLITLAPESLEVMRPMACSSVALSTQPGATDLFAVSGINLALLSAFAVKYPTSSDDD